MKRLTHRFKKWLLYRQRSVLRCRKLAAARFSRAPSIYRIVQHYELVQKFAKQLAYRDSFYVVWAYVQYLQTTDFHIPNDIEVAPQFLAAVEPRVLLAEWTLEQITREVIKCGHEVRQEGRRLRQWGALARIGNALRDLEGEIYATLVGAKKIHLELMRISHRQFIWQQQRPNTRWMIRYHKLFNRPAIDALSQRATGLSIDHIHLIGMAYLGRFLSHPFILQQSNIDIPGLTQQHIDRFLRFASSGLVELRNRLHAEHALDEGFAYRYSSLREFPLIRVSEGEQAEIACPIPTLLFWRITTGLYYALKDERGFPTAFGQSFQDYVGEVLRLRISNNVMHILEEAEFHIGKDRKDTVDWIIQQDPEAALFVECKTKRLTWASKAGLADLSALDQDLRKLAGAVVQTYRTVGDYLGNHYPQLPHSTGRRIYPVIVTLEDWYFFGHELPVRLHAAVEVVMARAGLPIEWLEEMPYSIMSVDEFETAAGIINTIGIHAFISGKLIDEHYRHWSYGAYCNDRYVDEVNNLPQLFDAEYQAMFAEVIAHHGAA
jgi:hypothetical protein